MKQYRHLLFSTVLSLILLNNAPSFAAISSSPSPAAWQSLVRFNDANASQHTLAIEKLNSVMPKASSCEFKLKVAHYESSNQADYVPSNAWHANDLVRYFPSSAIVNNAQSSWFYIYFSVPKELLDNTRLPEAMRTSIGNLKEIVFSYSISPSIGIVLSRGDQIALQGKSVLSKELTPLLPFYSRWEVLYKCD